MDGSLPDLSSIPESFGNPEVPFSPSGLLRPYTVPIGGEKGRDEDESGDDSDNESQWEYEYSTTETEVEYCFSTSVSLSDVESFRR